MWVVSAPRKVGGDEHPSPGGGPKVASNTASRCQLGGLGMDIYVARPLTCPRDVTMERLHPLYTFEVLLQHSHIPQHLHHTQSGFSSQCSPYTWSSHSSEGMVWASLDQDEALEDDFQTQHMPVHHVMQQEDDGCRSSAKGRLEYSGGSPGQQTEYQVDTGEEEEMLETVNPTWRTTCWLQLVVQGILDDEVPWYELVTPLMVGAKGVALSLAKCLLTIWWWSIKVQGWDVCPPALMVLNIGQFMTQEEVLGKVDNSLWFKAYSCALQRVGEAMHGLRWQWPKGKVQEVGVSPLVRAFWEETGIELATSCTKLCWELPPRGVFRRREKSTISHAITFLDDVAMRVPTLNAWDQFIWLPSAAMPRAAMEVEQYGYPRHFRSASPVFRHYIIYGTMTSCVMSRHCMCIGHVTFYYKWSANTSLWALFALASSFGSWFIQQVCPCHLRTAGV